MKASRKDETVSNVNDSPTAEKKPKTEKKKIIYRSTSILKFHFPSKNQDRILNEDDKEGIAKAEADGFELVS